MRLVLSAALLLSPRIAGASGSAQLSSGPRLIQIGIVPEAEHLDFVPEGGYAVADLEGRVHALKPNRTYMFTADDGQLSLENWTLPGEVRLTPDKIWADIKIGQKRYHGSLIVRANRDGTLTAIEELGIEEYLLGVLPHEMDPAWPIEALKAQAVVARTFAYTQLGKYKKSGFDLTSDTRSQVYGGLTDDPPSIREAVEKTKGEVLGYDGQILNVFYHSCCGGHTADQGSVWPTSGRTPKPLRGVRDKYCEAAPNFRWHAQLSYDQVLFALEKKRLLSGKLRRFEIGSRSVAGYVRTFIAKIGGERLEVGANDFRLAVGANQLKSARISRIKKTDDGVEFFGSGAGHGVGLCQWGARAQAEKGRRYEKILKYYFPGSTLSVIDE
jgi:stage II sporulation protein D